MKGRVGVPTEIVQLTPKMRRDLRAGLKFRKIRSSRRKPSIGLKDVSKMGQPILVKKK